MVQVNLLPDVKKELIRAKRTRNLVMTICTFTAIGVMGLTVVAWFWSIGLGLYKDSLSKSVDNKIACIQGKSSGAKDQCSLSAQDAQNLGEYLSVQNDLSLISSIKESQPQLSRMMEYFQAIFNTASGSDAQSTLHWSDWGSIKVNYTGDTVGVEISGQVDTSTARMVLRNRLSFAEVKYSTMEPDGKGGVKEGSIQSGEKLFVNFVPTREEDFKGGTQDNTTGRWPFKATLTFNPIIFKVGNRIHAIEIGKCTLWSSTYAAIDKQCLSNEESMLYDNVDTGANTTGGSQ